MADKIRTCGPKLRVAFQNHLVSLCDLLLAEYLITNDNASELRNTAQPEPVRASRLLEFIRNRVGSNEENYQAFVKALQKDRQYRDILIILGEKCPQPTGSPAAAPATSRSTSPVFQHFVETDVIQQHCADITAAIKENLPEFGMHMAQKGCCTQAKVDDITGLLGVGNFQKAGKLLEIITSRIKTSGSRKKARDIFNCLVFVLQFKLNHQGIAKTVVATMKKKDQSYVRPLPSHFDEECAQNSVQDSGKIKDGEMVTNSKQSGDSERSSDKYYAQEEDPDAPSTHVSGDKPKDNGDKPKDNGNKPNDNGEGAKETESQQGELERSSSKGSNISSPMQVSEDHDDHVGAMHPATECEDGGTMQPAADCGGGGRVECDSAQVKPNETPPKKDVASPSQPSQSGAGAGAESCAAMQKKLEYLNLAGGETKSKGIAFSKDMSEEEFKEFLISRGLCLQDCATITSNGFTAMGFSQNHFIEEDINCTELNFTRGGKRVLRALLKEISLSHS